MTKKSEGPTFPTAQEHDVYTLGLICGAVGALKGWCESPTLVGIEQVEDVIMNLSVYLENGLEFGENAFEVNLKEALGGTRVAVEALIKAWEKGYKNGLEIEIGPLPRMAEKKKK